MSNGATNVDQSANLTVMSYSAIVNEKGELTTEAIDHGMSKNINPRSLAKEFDKDGAITIELKGKGKVKVARREEGMTH